MGRFPWPKELRELAREGYETDGVITEFRPYTGDDGVTGLRAAARWTAPDGSERMAFNGLPFYSSNDPRGRGDVMRLLVSLEKDLAFALAEPESAQGLARGLREGTSTMNPLKWGAALRGPKVDWGRKVEGRVLAVAPAEGGGTAVMVDVEGRELMLGPVVTGEDPRRPGDLVDVGLGPDGEPVRVPTGPEPGAAELRAEMAEEPSRLRKIWESPWFPF